MIPTSTNMEMRIREVNKLDDIVNSRAENQTVIDAMSLLFSLNHAASFNGETGLTHMK